MASRSAAKRAALRGAFSLPLRLASGLVRWDRIALRPVPPHRRAPRKAAPR